LENLSRWKTFYDNRKLYIVETTSPTTNTKSFVLKINNLGYLINLGSKLAIPEKMITRTVMSLFVPEKEKTLRTQLKVVNLQNS
jgi:hypothetical protein